MSSSVQFDDFIFHADSGELFRRVGDGDPQLVQRLAPQPSLLLSLLLDRQPSIVTHEEIRAQLWPAVQVEYEQSLHFCIRQIRSALGESAANARYVQTIPRRGYRFVGNLMGVSSENGTSNRPAAADDPTATNDAALSKPGTTNLASEVPAPAASTQVAPSFYRRPWVMVTSIIAAFSFSLMLWINAKTTRLPPETITSTPATLRIAVMPFEPWPHSGDASGQNNIAEHLVELLTNDDVIDAHVVGPTTTVAYVDRTDGLIALIERFDIDFVLNGRLMTEPGSERLLAEVIRANDGAHVWVRELEDSTSSQDHAEAITTGLHEYLATRQQP